MATTNQPPPAYGRPIPAGEQGQHKGRWAPIAGKPNRKPSRFVLAKRTDAAASSTIVAAEALERLQPLIRQTVGVLFMVIGLNGSIMALNGRFENWLAVPLIALGTLVTVLAVRTIPRRAVRAAVLAGCVALLYALNEVAGPLVYAAEHAAGLRSSSGLVKGWAITGGLIVQCIVTLFQWTYCRHKTHPYYLSAVIVDAGLNVRGYGLVMLAPLVGVLALALGHAWWAIPAYIFWAAWGIIGVFSVAVAVFGEHILVRK